MSEQTLQIIASCKIAWIAAFSAFYGFGGISNKWLRRFCGSAWMGIGVTGFSLWTNSFHFWYLAYPVLLMIALTMGYSGDEILVKIRKRFLCGLAIAISSLPLVFPSHLFILWTYGAVLSIFTSVLLGSFNISKDARSEETLIASIGSIIPLFLI